MDEGFMYAFKNCWGLKNAPCKQGVVQDLNRMNYLGYVSHIRRINTPLSIKVLLTNSDITVIPSKLVLNSFTQVSGNCDSSHP